MQLPAYTRHELVAGGCPFELIERMVSLGSRQGCSGAARGKHRGRAQRATAPWSCVVLVLSVPRGFVGQFVAPYHSNRPGTSTGRYVKGPHPDVPQRLSSLLSRL